jgi:hypothetical protein
MSVSTTTAAPARTGRDDLQGILGGAPWPEPERAVQHIRLDDRLEHDLQRGLHDPVRHRRDRQRPLLRRRAGLGNPHPARRKRSVAAALQHHGKLVEQPVNPVLLDLLDGYLVDARRATVAAHLLPRPLQDIPAEELVVQRVEPSSGIGLGRPVQRMLQGTDRVEIFRLLNAHRGGTSHDGHSPALLASLRADEAAALPITGGCVARPARSVLRPPPTPCWLAVPFPVARL